MTAVIYMATNLVNGHRYIGRATEFWPRFYSHIYKAKNGDREPICAAIRKYGIDMLRFRVIKIYQTEAQAMTEETRLVALWNPEYNVKRGTSGRHQYKAGPRRQRKKWKTVVDLDGEEWRAIVEYNGRYEVSNYGRVRRPECIIKYKYRSIRLPISLLKVGTDKRGRKMVWLCNKLKICAHRPIRDRRYIHALVAQVFIGPRPAGMVVCHKNGNLDDNTPQNLYYGTQAQNMKDRDRHGRTVRGIRMARAKLTDDAVREILSTYKPYDKSRGGSALARKFGVSDTVVWQVIHKKTWRHVE
jgi:hypothetical protein